ncbi:putative Ca2+/H+ antiporter, TMEM165/GDT1 family [Streptoalloteichus tenebrarius]|uniref:GDT1 family protein n=1 Tax=Streptoalloteichus tenebrarius (strain ATCC 17920 / DSM 40477 / JCM 4838 / CBS 697.72 / NBRC 16177 / NCIMB 11028 / NRRL B-12390 / A12253. 1 / ISP 5477) TaxID=1933 RepID=A0ABT1I449_STRSD|nr:TMEM165/GDT1 family protein [Streptoalloteichus tenebrarius]MCP2262574.1 putative Ca2+/H+ antiporter, TMEM165/GDT1 family [Streptoalloteichus tenebrarius]BFF01834.1 TMEM165/GDT1 family protein [Streptoalloteichus tenebrarius]
MASWLLALVTAFGAVFLLELPDKTTALTLVLTGRFPALPVIAGSSVAFALQSVIAVAFGSVLTLLPGRLVAVAVAVVFGIGAVMLLREGFGAPEADEADDTGPPRAATTFWRAALTSFGALFAAEWGDASQLAAVGVAARYAEPVAVVVGSFLALMSVTLLAVLVGRAIRDRVPAHLVQRGAGFVFAAFALVATYQAVA